MAAERKLAKKKKRGSKGELGKGGGKSKPRRALPGL